MVEERNWKRLCTPPTNLDYEIVREFYVNSIPVQGKSYEVNVSGAPKNFLRKELKITAHVMMTLVFYNIRTRSHTSSIPLDTAYLLYYILGNRQVDVARIILNEIKMIAKSGHQLRSKIPCTLAFLWMIMGLCIRSRISMPPVDRETVDDVINDRYIERYCMTKGALTLNDPQPPTQQPFDERATCTYTWDMLEANERAFWFMHDFIHQLGLQIREPHLNNSLPSREAFQQHVNWLEGMPFHQERAFNEDEETEEEENGDEEYMSDED
ncbi:hypothetical protein KIW84_013537 [Lathyrus oleraceus]|uniref:Putative plant transposon protein domain-containing protein n=1 Tax=Pisum sativum TaxID=3888 RepID=A0A9D5BKP2_PEA|nr:hypothetical protein KIW84_013537 [Pisum sativum]